MPSFEITAPNGKKYRVTGPEGATAEQALAQVQGRVAQQEAGEADVRRMADPTGSFGENVLAGAGKAMTDVGRGVGQMLGMTSRADIDESKRRDAPLMATGGGITGNIAGNLVMLAPTALIPGVNTLTGAATVGAATGALQPVATGESRALNTIVGAGAGAGAQKVAKVAGTALSNKLYKSMDDAAARAAVNLERDTTLKAAREAGYVVPPSQAGGGIASRSLEGLSNKISVQQTASARNQEVTNQLSRKALALPDDAPLNEATLTALRDTAAEPYRQVAALSPLASKKLETLKQVRSDATGFHRFYDRSADPSALKQARFMDAKAADLESQLEKIALKAKQPDLVDELRAARKVIAKSYTVERAVKEGTGNVDATLIAKALNKGVPLEDELRVIARFANKFPKAAQTPEKTGSVPMFTLTDAALAAAGGLANPALVALGAARPAARSIALSGPVQRSLASPNYGPSAALRGAQSAFRNQRLRRLLPGAAAAGALDYSE